MSSSVVFTGSGFYVASASQDVAGTVRVKFSTAPLASSSVGAHDALNPSNYTLSGPGAYTIVSIQPVGADPLSFDILLASGLAVGTWTLAVTSVQTAATNPLTSPTAAQFMVTSTVQASPLSGGAEQDDPESIIRKHLSSALKGESWDALIRALSVGDEMNWLNAEAAFDQLFTSSASGSWLERKASDNGLIKPLNVGIDDDLFRKLSIKTNANKVVHEAIREILEIYYGQDSLRAFVEASLDESYNLTGGLDLSWTLDEKDSFSHTFVSSEFGSISASKAVEIAFVLTKTMRDAGGSGFAVAYQSPLTGLNRVRIYSGSLGLGSFVRVTGGMAQNVLQFPTSLSVYSGTVSAGTGYTWSYSRPDTSTTRVTLTFDTASIANILDLSLVQVGDYVNIGSTAQIGQTGTFPVLAVAVSWSGTVLTQSFDIPQIAFNSTALQTSNLAYSFFRPTKSSILASGGRTVVVAQTVPGQIDIKIPATTQVVSRGPGKAAYGRVNNSISINRVVRNALGLATVTTTAPHGLTVGSWVQIDGFIPSPTQPYITPSNGASYPSSFSYAASPISIIAESQTPPNAIAEGAAAVTLSNGQLLFTGGYTRTAGTIVNGSGFLSSGTPTDVTSCNRYVAGAQGVVSDSTEADGSAQSTHTWLATNTLNFAREQHAATTYGTGAIVSGGMSGNNILQSAEQYLVGGIWVNIAPMINLRAGHSLVTLNNGNILAMGGANTEGSALTTTEIFNGTSWSSGPGMNTARTDFQALKLSNGNVMVIGGRTMGLGHRRDPQTLALWRLDEFAGTTVNEATGTYPLTATGGPVTSFQGKINSCWDFNTANSYHTGPGDANAVNALLGEWTLELWFKRSTNAAGQFFSYGGASELAADNLLINAGIDVSGYLFWKWENGAGNDVTQTTTNTLASNAIYRAGWFNHFALRKAFTAPQTVIIGTRTSNVTTLTFNAAHGFSVSDVVYFNSGDTANFSTGSKTITAVTSTTISYAETAADVVYENLTGYVGKNFDVTIYINGTPIQTWTNQANASGGTSGAWYIARQPELGTSGFQGFLDDVRVSSVARSEADIREDFYRGWGNQKPAGAADRAIGAVTSTTEIYDGSSWTYGPRMTIGRCFHRAILLPGDYILVHGGIGHDTTIVPPINFPAAIGLWPNNSLKSAEIYDPTVGRWFHVASAGVRRSGHVLVYLPTANKVIAFGGVSLAQDPNNIDDAGYVEILDLTTRTWKTSPSKYRTPAGDVVGLATPAGTEVVMVGGFDQTGVTNTKALTYIPGSDNISGSGINGQHRVSSVPSTTTFQFSTTATSIEKTYSSTHGSRFTGDDGTWNQAKTGGDWVIATGSRTSNLTTLTLSFPTGYSSHDILVGDWVYVNSRTSAFASGLKQVLATSTTTISYAETASNQTSIAVIGSVSESWSTPTESAIAAAAQPINDPGPYMFDPAAGLAVTDIESTTISFPLYGNQSWKEVEIDNSTGSADSFPDANGYVVFGFGTASQMGPVKCLGKYRSGPTSVRLTLDYSFKFTKDQAIGTKVTMLSQRAPYAPTNQPGSFYITASSAGRVAAQASAEAALAAGVEANVTVVYPGDRGLGGEGYPHHGAQKLSDVVEVFAGDNIDEEVQLDRES